MIKRLRTKAVNIISFAGLTVAFLAGCNDTQLAGQWEELDAPIAVIQGGATAYGTLETVIVDGIASYDPDDPSPGAITDYIWSMASKPSGSATSTQSSGFDGSGATVFVDVAGIYTVQLVVVDQDGQHSAPATFEFEGIPFEDLHVEVNWDVDITDVDVHLLNKSNGGVFFQPPYDCFYANTSPDWGPIGNVGNPTLDIDDVNGYGPENINIVTPENDHEYKVIVHYYSDDGIGATNATVKIFLSGQLKYESVQNLSSTGKTWEVAEIAWPSGNVTPLDTVYNYTPSL